MEALTTLRYFAAALTMMFGLLFYVSANEIREVVQTFLGTNNLATKQEIIQLERRLSEEITDLRLRIDHWTGEDKLVRLDPDFSYVIEPVLRTDESVRLRLRVQRTSLGEDCTLIKGSALFVDQRNIGQGSPLGKPSRQLTTEWATIEIEIPLPKTPDGDTRLVPGRVALSLHLDYQCGNSPRLVNNPLGPIHFILL